MSHSLYAILPAFAALAFIATVVVVGLGPLRLRNGWVIAAALSALFTAWTIWAVRREGALGFWSEHVRGAWSNQIWFDLLLAAGLALALLLPRARAVGMKTWPWVLLVICTGSVGLLALAARCFCLEGRQRRTTL